MKRIILTALLSATILTLGAQNMHDYNFITSTNLWLGARNGAALVTFEQPRIAIAELSAEKANGRYVGIEGSDNSIKGGVSTESYAHISDRINAFGRLSYSYFHGKNMGGPIFLDPSYNPFSLLESDPSTIGIKTKEFYTLDGGLSYKLSDKWAIGTYIDYTSGLSAKRKDPRFRNVYMDLDLSLGVRFQPSSRTSLGASLLYQRMLEKVDGKKFGNQALDFFTLINYGGFLSKKEIFSGDYGYMPEGSGSRNMFNSLYGVALQCQAGNSKLGTFHELKFLYRDGYYGNKGSSNITYSEHSSLIFGYSGALLINSRDNVQKIGLELGCELLGNKEKVFRTNTETGKQTIIQYFGDKEVLERALVTERLYWQGWSGLDGYRADWEYGASLSGEFCSQAATIFPSTTQSDIFTIALEGGAKRNITIGGNIITPELGLGFYIGGGNPQKESSVSSSSLIIAEEYLNRDFEYKSIASLGGTASITFTRIIKDGLDAYIRLSDQYKQCLTQPQYLGGKYRNILMLTIGCTF